MPEDFQQPHHPTVVWTLAIISSVLMIGIGIVLFLSYSGTLSRIEEAFLPPRIQPLTQRVDTLPPREGSTDAKIENILLLNASKDYKASVDAYNAVVASPDITENEKARAALNVISAGFRDTGNVADYIKNVEDLKAAYLMPGVDLNTKTTVLNMIASSYCRSGQQPAVFNAIYSGEFFQDFKVPNDPDASAKKLFEYSLSLNPSAKAAERIARWYSEQALAAPASSSRRTDAGNAAISFIQQADVLGKKDEKTYLHIENNALYLSYKFWRAYNIGLLAQAGFTQYRTQYKQAYADFFNLLKITKQTGPLQQFPFAHTFYAQALLAIDADRTEADASIQQAIDFVKADTNVKANEFKLFLKDQNALRLQNPTSDALKIILGVRKHFPQFKAFMDEVVAAE